MKNGTKQDKTTYLFDKLDKNNMGILKNFYHPDAKFIDPVGEHQGLEEIKNYYLGLYKNVTSIRFEHLHWIESQDDCVLIWRMYLKAKALNDGKEIVLSGNSHLTFDNNNMVIYHRDYFDMGEFIYEHIFLLDRIIKYIKKRLKQS